MLYLFIHCFPFSNYYIYFRCEDLEKYAAEVGVQTCLLLLNKSDLLTEKQRQIWAEYFDQHVCSIFFILFFH